MVVGGYGLPLLTFLHVSLGSPLAGAGEVGLSFSLSVLWLFWGRGAEWLSCHSIVWSGWWGCYTGEFWSWSCSQGTAALAQSSPGTGNELGPSTHPAGFPSGASGKEPMQKT